MTKFKLEREKLNIRKILCKGRRRNKEKHQQKETMKMQRKKSKKTKFVDEVKANGSTSSSKQQMKKQSQNCDAEVLSTDTSDKEVSLAVEDLLSIAGVYVSADRKRQCKDQTVNDKSSEPSSCTIYSKFGVEGAILFKFTNNSLSSHLVRNKENGSSKENQSKNDKIDNICSSDISTGDAMQDMLNLYLGPFINKPAPPAELSVKAVESENFSVVQAVERKRMPLVSKFNRQVGSFEIPKVESDGRLMKKKSSLRDKVAMFID